MQTVTITSAVTLCAFALASVVINVASKNLLKNGLNTDLQRHIRSLPFSLQNISSLDGNRDQIVTFAEFMKLTAQMPYAGMTSTELELLIGSVAVIFQMIDSVPDSRATLAEINNACFTISALLAWDYDPDVWSYNDTCKLAANACHNGTISQFNVSKSQRAWVAFQYLDYNGDGQVTHEEYNDGFFIILVYVFRDYRAAAFLRTSQYDMCLNVLGPFSDIGYADDWFSYTDVGPADGVITLPEFDSFIVNLPDYYFFV